MNTKVQGVFLSLSEAFNEFASAKTVGTVVSVALILIVGLGIVRLLFNASKKFSRKKLPLRSATIIENIIKYAGYAIVLLTATRRARTRHLGLPRSGGHRGDSPRLRRPDLGG